MAVYEVFSRPIVIRYKTTLCSNTTLFYIATVLIKYICPFILTYYSQGFWRKIDFYHEQPDISFKHKMLIILETTSPEELMFWSTYENINKVMEKQFLQTLPEVEHQEMDYNKDGKKDELLMSIEFPLSKQDIVSAKVLLIFDYKLHLYSNFRMESAAYLHHSSPLPGAEYNVIGDLMLFQKEPLRHIEDDEKFNTPIIKESNIDSTTNLENILRDYIKRNVTTIFSNAYPVWKSARAENMSFKISISMKYPAGIVLYRIEFWQMLKWALVQYISVFVIISFIIHSIRNCIFCKHYLSTITANPLKKNK